MALDLDYKIDEKTYRHSLNGFQTVLHCHHYMTLTTQLAEKLQEFGGPRVLAESAEDAFRPFFDDYVKKHGLPAGEARLQMAKEIYARAGMGHMESTGTADGGEVTMTRSHVDQGWIMKFGKADHSLNYFTCGFISAMFGCAFDKPPRSYQVEETASIVKGDPQSTFSVKAL